MLTDSVLPFFTVLLTFVHYDISVNCATFQNVTMMLYTTEGSYRAKSAAVSGKSILISSSDSLAKFIDKPAYRIMKIRNQMVPKLTKRCIADLPEVRTIQITTSGLQTIEAEAFYNLPSLLFLNLSGNSLDNIPNGAFSGLKSLNMLNLDHNSISKFDSKVFNNLPNLHQLYLHHNKISEWKSDWFTGSPISFIQMGHNLIETLPANAFSYLVEIQRAKGSANFFRINFHHNKLKTIHPDAFKGVSKILFLSLDKNELTSLPVGIFKSVKSMIYLNLSNNKIVSIDVGAVFNDTRVPHILLKNNKLTCLPLDFVAVTKAKEVNLDGNPVTCDCVKAWKEKQKGSKSVVSFGKTSCLN